MHTLDHRLAHEHDAISFVRLSRREQNRRNQARAKQTAEALQAAQTDLPFEALGEDMPEVMSRLEEQT